jgi:hypothetical protein
MSMMRLPIIVPAAATAIALVLAACGPANAPGASSSGGLEGEGPLRKRDANDPHDGDYWLENAQSDAERFRLIQDVQRGFDQPMWEVGERFERFELALADGNLPLAKYHWEKINRTIEVGLIKRPRRGESARQLFVESAWPQVQAQLETGDLALARAALPMARQACRSCHVAENVAYMNDQPLLRDP